MIINEEKLKQLHLWNGQIVESKIEKIRTDFVEDGFSEASQAAEGIRDLIEGFNIYNQKEATLKYELNNEEENTVATVNDFGEVKILSEGIATIRCTNSYGKYDECVFTVYNKDYVK